MNKNIIIKIIILLFGFIVVCISSPAPSNTFDANIVATVKNLGVYNVKANYDLPNGRAAATTSLFGTQVQAIVRRDLGKVYEIQGDTCQSADIPSQVDFNIWDWLNGAADLGPSSFRGKSCEKWQGTASNLHTTIVGCFSGNVPAYVNGTNGSQFAGDSIIFNSFNSRPQNPSIFNVPSNCNNKNNLYQNNKISKVSNKLLTLLLGK